jgi:glycosyltransferase involved in cell wall biosynthesis
VHLTGRVPREELGTYLRALDVASLPQSVDGVGSFRYTTKLSEYLAAGLPVVTGQIPLAYDLDEGWLWRLPGDAPWEDRYVSALARLMDSLTAEELAERRARAPAALAVFSKRDQQERVSDFLNDVAHV